MATRFPLLFEIEKRKRCFIAERLTDNGVKWMWKRAPKEKMEMGEISQLERILTSVSIKNCPDLWSIKLAADGVFRVHDLRALIDLK